MIYLLAFLFGLPNSSKTGIALADMKIESMLFLIKESYLLLDISMVSL